MSMARFHDLPQSEPSRLDSGRTQEEQMMQVVDVYYSNQERDDPQSQVTSITYGNYPLVLPSSETTGEEEGKATKDLYKSVFDFCNPQPEDLITQAEEDEIVLENFMKT